MIATIVAASLHLILVSGLLGVVALVVAATSVVVLAAAAVRLVVAIAAIAATTISVMALARTALLSIWVRRVVVSLRGGILLVALTKGVVGALEGDLVRAVLTGLVGGAGAGTRVVCTVLLSTAAVITPTTVVVVASSSVVLVVEGLALVVGATVPVVPSIVVPVVVAAAAASIPAIITPVVVKLAISIAGLPVEVRTTTASMVIVVVAISVVSKLLIFGGASVLVAVIMVMATAHTAAMAVTSTTTSLTVPASNLLAVWWDHSWLISTHLVVTHGSIVSPMEAASAASRWEGRPSASAPSATPAATAATTSLVAALVLGFSLLDIDSSPINLRNGIVLDKILCDGLVREGDEAEAARGTGVDIFEDDGIMHLTKLHEVLLELLGGQLEVEAAHKDLALRIRELNGVLRVIAAAHSVLLHDLDVGVRLLDLLPVVGHHEVVVLMVATALVSPMVVSMVATAATSHVSALTAALVIVSRLNVDALVKDVVPFGLVLPDNASFDLLGLVLVIEAEKHETKASATLRNFLAHHNRVLDLAKFLEVGLQVLLQGAEGQTADEKFNLVLLSRLVERGRRSVAAATATCLVTAHVASAHPS